MKKISLTDRVLNEVPQRVKKTINILHTIKSKKANRTGHILLRNCLLIHVIQTKIKGKGRSDGKTKK
jgi:hypothetical protein